MSFRDSYPTNTSVSTLTISRSFKLKNLLANEHIPTFHYKRQKVRNNYNVIQYSASTAVTNRFNKQYNPTKKLVVVGAKVNQNLHLGSFYLLPHSKRSLLIPFSLRTTLNTLARFFSSQTSFSRTNPLVTSLQILEEGMSKNNLLPLNPQFVEEVAWYKMTLAAGLESSTRDGFLVLRNLVFQRCWQVQSSGLLSTLNNLKRLAELYLHFGRTSANTLYQKYQSIAFAVTPSLYLVYWTFTKTHRLYINMRNKTDMTYNYFSISPGLFLKFYKNKRPLKRSKLFKLLVVKFLRKLLLASSIKHLYIIPRRSPTLFAELFKRFMTPEINPYRLPYHKGSYDDSIVNSIKPAFSIHKFIFAKTKFFGTFKDRRRGRLKRKIARRLIKKNNIMD